MTRAQLLAAIPGLVGGDAGPRLAAVVTAATNTEIGDLVDAARADARQSGYRMTAAALADEVLVRLANEHDVAW